MESYNEYELISHSKLADCTMFIVDMVYRPMHLHKELELCVVLSGSCRVSTDRARYCCLMRAAAMNSAHPACRQGF